MNDSSSASRGRLSAAGRFTLRNRDSAGLQFVGPVAADESVVGEVMPKCLAEGDAHKKPSLCGEKLLEPMMRVWLVVEDIDFGVPGAR